MDAHLVPKCEVTIETEIETGTVIEIGTGADLAMIMGGFLHDTVMDIEGTIEMAHNPAEVDMILITEGGRVDPGTVTGLLDEVVVGMEMVLRLTNRIFIFNRPKRSVNGWKNAVENVCLVKNFLMSLLLQNNWHWTLLLLSTRNTIKVT